MSTTLHISAHVDPQIAPDAFCVLVTSLLKHAEVHDLYTLIDSLERSRRHVPLASMRDSARETVTSDCELVADLTYELASGRHLGIEVAMPGSGFRGGLDVAVSGAITLTFPARAIAPRLVQPSEALTIASLRNRAGLGPDAIRNELARTPGHYLSSAMAACLDLDGLFLHVCAAMLTELPVQENVAVAMYAEAGWRPPPDCFMLCHSRPREFARDFARGYASYHWGTSPARMFRRFSCLADLRAMEKMHREEPLSATLASVLPHAKGTASIFLEKEGIVEQIAFYDSIQAESADAMCALSDSDAGNILLGVPDETLVGLYQVGREGVALAGAPLTLTLRSAYSYVYRTFMRNSTAFTRRAE